MTSRNEKVREYMHVALDKVIDQLLHLGQLERAGLVYFDIQRAFHDVDEGTIPDKVTIEHVEAKQQWTNQTTTP